MNLHTNRGFWWRRVHRHPGDEFVEASDYYGRILNWLRLTQTAGGGGGGAPEWLPDGAVAFADFVNGHFYAGGAETTLGAIISNATTDADGLVVENGTTAMLALGAFASACTLSATYVCEGADDAGNPDADFPGTFVALHGGDSLHYAEVKGYQAYITTDDFNTEYLLVDAGSVPGHSKAATTLSLAAVSQSLNGDDTTTDTSQTLSSFAISEVNIGGFTTPNWTGRIKTLAIYAPQDDSDLPALSALS